VTDPCYVIMGITDQKEKSLDLSMVDLFYYVCLVACFDLINFAGMEKVVDMDVGGGLALQEVVEGNGKSDLFAWVLGYEIYSLLDVLLQIRQSSIQ